ncbi:hypothetical protein, partial [Streptomyces otsuchiensis]|uniref:hypothetical protein n=1 Tax=Streptomyces otsuchiensis TaxID=2681388 RepID=UPI001030AC3C
ASPAHAATDESGFGGGVNAANNWNFTAADVCVQELAVVPVRGEHHADAPLPCGAPHVIAHS